jgi:hypothetical protein
VTRRARQHAEVPSIIRGPGIVPGMRITPLR